MKSQPLKTLLLNDEPYVRKVEVVALDTLIQLINCDLRSFTLELSATNMYSRRSTGRAEVVSMADCRNVDLIPHPAWKVCGADRYLVEEIGHTTKLSVRGMESWPEWNGGFSVRYGTQHVAVSDERGPFVLIGGDKNHYHWVLNFVPRLLILELAQAQGFPLADALLLVPEEVSDNAIGLLRALGYGDERIVRVKSGHVMRFAELYVPSFFPHFEFSPNLFRWYGHKFAARRKKQTPSQRIVISRGDLGITTQRRRVINEEVMIAALGPLGFKPHNLGRLTMDEQIDLFLDAEFVIGPHGAGFANMAFCQPGAKAIVLENSWNHTFMADMLNVSGAKAEVLVCEDVIDLDIEAKYALDPGNSSELRRNRDMSVDIPSLVARVHAMLSDSCRASEVNPL